MNESEIIIGLEPAIDAMKARIAELEGKQLPPEAVATLSRIEAKVAPYLPAPVPAAPASAPTDQHLVSG